MAGGASALVLTALVFLVSGCAGRHRATSADDHWTAFVRALDARHLLEARLADLPAPPYPAAVERSGSPKFSADLRIAAGLVELTAKDQPSARNLLRVGAVRLVAGDVDGALEAIERAQALGESAATLGALSAVFLTRGEQLQEPRDIARALDMATRATFHEGDDYAGHFNRALALERLGLTAEAAEVWGRAAASVDAGWRRQALQRATRVRPITRDEELARIDRLLADGPQEEVERTVAQAPDLAAEAFERGTLVRRVRCEGAACSGEAQRSRWISHLLARATGDNLWADLERGLAPSWPDYVEAVRAWDDDNLELAKRCLRRVRTRHSSIEWALVELAQAAIDRRSGGADRALIRLTGVLRGVGKHYPTLRARALWQRGLLAGETGNFGRSLADLERAARLFESLRDREGFAAVNALVAYSYLQFDDLSTAWKHLHKALSVTPALRRVRRDPVLTAAGLLAAADQLHAAAIELRASAKRDAERAGYDVGLAFLLLDEVTDLTAMGQAARADDILREARMAALSIREPRTRTMSLALADATEATLRRHSDPKRAALLFTRAAEQHESLGQSFAIPGLMLELGRTLGAAGRLDEARIAYRGGLKVATDSYLKARPAQRSVIHQVRWDLHVALADLELNDSARDDIREFLDRGRAPGLEKPRFRRRSEPRPDVAVLSFAVLPSRVVAWVTTRAGLPQFFELAIRGPQLERLIEQHRDALRSHRNVEERGHAAQLFDVLLGPARHVLAGMTQLVIVPDGPLFHVPFSALWDRDSRKYVVERWTVRIAPAARVAFDHTVGGDRVKSGTLLVSADRVLGLPGLPGARGEVAALHSLYPSAEVLMGDQSTREGIVAALGTASVFHFAGHAIANHATPGMSRLALSPGAGDDDGLGALIANEIEQLNLAHLRLVILAGCETSRGVVVRGDGAIGLPRAFLGAGASTVIATLWPIEDTASRELFVTFHRLWRDGQPSAVALRNAQLALIRTGAHAGDWAPVQVIGRDVSRVGR